MLVVKARRKDPAADDALTESQKRVSLLFKAAFAEIRQQLERDEGRLLDALMHRPTAYVVSMVDFTPLFEIQERLSNDLLGDLRDGGTRAAAAIKPRAVVKAEVKFVFDRANERGAKWAASHAAALIREVSQEQQATVRDLVSRALMGEMDARTVARNLKDVIGLTSRQAEWVTNHYRRQMEEHGDAARADASTARYSQRIQRYRRENIARTEILTASNEGRRQAWRQAAEEGWIPRSALKQWSTNFDGRQCDECEGYDGEQAQWFEAFPWGDPPVHPSCRCSVLLVEPDIPQDILDMNDDELDEYVNALIDGGVTSTQPYDFPYDPSMIDDDPMGGAVNANPNYLGTDRGYRVNCTNCVAAMEYRRRGYGVTAKPLPQGRYWDQIMEMWRKPGGDAVTASDVVFAMGKTELKKAWEQLPDGSHFVLQFAWRQGSSAHIIWGEKKGGKVRLFDPQNGSEVPTTGQSYWSRVYTGSMRLMRTDELTLNDPKGVLEW